MTVFSETFQESIRLDVDQGSFYEGVSSELRKNFETVFYSGIFYEVLSYNQSCRDALVCKLFKKAILDLMREEVNSLRKNSMFSEVLDDEDPMENLKKVSFFVKTLTLGNKWLIPDYGNYSFSSRKIIETYRKMLIFSRLSSFAIKEQRFSLFLSISTILFSYDFPNLELKRVKDVFLNLNLSISEEIESRFISLRKDCQFDDLSEQKTIVFGFGFFLSIFCKSDISIINLYLFAIDTIYNLTKDNDTIYNKLHAEDETLTFCFNILLNFKALCKRIPIHQKLIIINFLKTIDTFTTFYRYFRFCN